VNRAPLQTILLSLESGTRPKGGASADSGEIPSLGGEHVNDEGGFDFTNIKRIPRSFFATMQSGIVAPFDILVVKDGATTGKTSIVREDFPFKEAAVNEHVFCVRVDPKKALPIYVYHFLRSPIGQIAIQRDFRGATVGGISREFAIKTILPLPPLEEQQRLAEILDRAEWLRARRRAALVQLESLADASFLDLFGDPDKNPKGLSIEPLGKYLRFVTSGGRGWAEFYASTGVRFIRSLDVQMNHIGDKDLAFVVPPDNAEARRTKVKAGDVLLTITGSRIGRVAAVPNDLEGSFISQHVAILRADPKHLDFRFLSFFLSLEIGGQRQIAKFQYGQTKPGLNFEQIRNFQIPIPPIQDQQDFARRVAAVDKLKTTYHRSVEELNSLFAVLQDQAFQWELQR
jgi:type I restriction enzyme, S subunit